MRTLEFCIFTVTSALPDKLIKVWKTLINAVWYKLIHTEKCMVHWQCQEKDQWIYENWCRFNDQFNNKSGILTKQGIVSSSYASPFADLYRKEIVELWSHTGSSTFTRFFWMSAFIMQLTLYLRKSFCRPSLMSSNILQNSITILLLEGTCNLGCTIPLTPRFCQVFFYFTIETLHLYPLWNS